MTISSENYSFWFLPRISINTWTAVPEAYQFKYVVLISISIEEKTKRAIAARYSCKNSLEYWIVISLKSKLHDQGFMTCLNNSHQSLNVFYLQINNETVCSHLVYHNCWAYPYLIFKSGCFLFKINFRNDNPRFGL